ncbi:MAG: hypothetical protein EA402_07360 [Planctomycetota bacterium]|nr:MAG: hypothetical protein EA402_07360 [Planctomycetota bacterium]
MAPDGTIYLAGNALGPTLELPGVRMQILGRDTRQPNFTMPTRGSGDQRRINPPKWTHTEGAGFIVRLARGEGSFAAAVRFPWGAGSITDMVADGRGGIYVSGVVGKEFAQLTEATRHQAAGIDGPGELFVGKINADLSGFVWCRRISDNPEQPPKLRVLEGGTLAVMGIHVHHLQPADGQVLRSQPGALSNAWVTARNPEDFTWAGGAMRHTNTGYEPWRQPFLYVRTPENDVIGHYYQWHSRLVGKNWSRLVSDSEVRGLDFDRKGNLLIYGWSDGGNSVFEFAPYDLKTPVRRAAQAATGRATGLGFSTWGANVGSFAHIIRIDPRTGTPLAKANFIAYLASENKPSSVQIQTINAAIDDSVLLTGASAFGLIETGSTKINTLDHAKGDYIGREFVAVLNESLSDIRFSSAVPGSGRVPLQRHSGKREGSFAVASARVGNKTRVVFVSGATAHEKFKPVNNAQGRFGGGDLDGLYIVLEMDTLKSEMLPYAQPGNALSAGATPEAGESREISGDFKVSAGMNRDNSLIVLRDGGGRKWPTFYMARPQGEGNVRSNGSSGQFTLHGSGTSVEMGDTTQARAMRLGGHLGSKQGDDFHYPEIAVEITVNSTSQATAKVTYAGNTVNRQGGYSVRPSRPVGRGIQVHGVFEFRKHELGLSESREDREDLVYLEIWAPGRP